MSVCVCDLLIFLRAAHVRKLMLKLMLPWSFRHSGQCRFFSVARMMHGRQNV